MGEASDREGVSDSERGDLLVVTQAYPPETGGNASRIGDLAGHLTDEWDVTGVAPPPCYPHGEFERSWRGRRRQRDGDVTVHRLWTWQPTDPDPGFAVRMAYYLLFAAHAFVWLLVRRGEFDVVVTTSPPISTGLVALPFAAVGELPWVLDVRDLWIDVSASFGFIAEDGVVERLATAYREVELQRADLVTVTTEGTVDRLADAYEFETEVAVIPNGVDAAAFAAPGEDGDVGSAEGGSDRDDDRRQIVYVGTIGHCQALEPFVTAMEYMESAAVFRIVGDGDRRAELERVVAAEGLEDRVVFEGLVPRGRVPSMLADSAIGIATIEPDESLAYAIPTKVFEYMGTGLPVVAYGEGEIRQIVDRSGGGVMVDGDPEAIASVLDALLADEERREEMGIRGRQFVEERYDRGVIAGRLSRRLREVVGGGDAVAEEQPVSAVVEGE